MMLEPTLRPNMAIAVPGSISGAAIIDDLLSRIGARLERDCNLRQSDSYASYAASVKIAIQLRDVDLTEVVNEVVIGLIDESQPVPHIAMDTTAEGQRGSPLGEGLEHPVDPVGVEEQPQRRQYVSRIRGVPHPRF